MFERCGVFFFLRSRMFERCGVCFLRVIFYLRILTCNFLRVNFSRENNFRSRMFVRCRVIFFEITDVC